jgi:hypothetical protein
MMKLKTNQNFTKSPRTKIKKWIKSKEKINWEAGLKIQRVGQENQWEERKVGGKRVASTKPDVRWWCMMFRVREATKMNQKPLWKPLFSRRTMSNTPPKDDDEHARADTCKAHVIYFFNYLFYIKVKTFLTSRVV